MNDFQTKYGPWALVTGANAGIGKAIAHELAARKLNIVAVARRRHLLEALKEELEKQYGVRVYPLAIDLTEPEVVEKLGRATENKVIGLIVPAAGMADAGEFTTTAPERNTAMARLNMIAPMQLVQLFANKMVKRRRGGVLFVSSLFGYQGIPYMANYAATKAYILAFGEALYVELGKHGVDVSVLSPGLTDTDMPANLPLDFSKLPMFYQSPQEVAKTGIKALGRKPTVVSGWVNKFYAWQNRLVPRSLPTSLFGFLIKRAFKN
jgi:short-subunit dehydrogenase